MTEYKAIVSVVKEYTTGVEFEGEYGSPNDKELEAHVRDLVSKQKRGKQEKVETKYEILDVIEIADQEETS